MWDYETMFSSNQAVTATALSQKAVRVPEGDIGKGRPVYIQVKGGLYTGTGTITVEVQTADDDAFSTPDTIAAYEISNDKIVKGGSLLVAALPTGVKKFLWLNYVVSGTLTGGNIISGLVLQGQTAV